MSHDSLASRVEILPTAGKILGLLLFAALLIAPAPAGLSPEGKRLAAATVLMAIFWLTQAIPIAATSLIPLVAFPFLGIQSADTVSQSYINKNIFLFLGGFVIALGIEKWGLHRRIALHVVRILGTSVRRVVLGFMLATAFLSMWISNTASTLLMLPIGLAMLASFREMSTGDSNEAGGNTEGSTSSPDDALSRLSVALMLGICYAASIGGLMTLVGTPTNVQFVQIWSDNFPRAPEFSAGEWMIAVVPLGAVLMVCAWVVLVWRLPPLPAAQSLDREFISNRLRALGPPSSAERRMLVIFLTTATLWIFRKPLRIGAYTVLPGWGGSVEEMLLSMGTNPDLAARAVHDSTVAIGMALLLFLIPADRDARGRTRYLMDWKTAETLPWGILLLIGGGFAIANAFRDTGLSAWIGDSFAQAVHGWPPWMLVAAICLLLTFLTELTSNVATVSTLLPILAGTAVSLEIDPRLIMVPAAISASCAFMLPIATPPNAIIFGSGKVTMGQMVRHGIVLNLVGVVMVTIVAYLYLVPQLGISLDTMPAWADPTK